MAACDPEAVPAKTMGGLGGGREASHHALNTALWGICIFRPAVVNYPTLIPPGIMRYKNVTLH